MKLIAKNIKSHRAGSMLFLAACFIMPACSQPVKLYHCMVDLEAPQKAVMKTEGIPEAQLLDGRYIDPNKTGKVDSALLANAVQQHYPDPLATGVGILDWEDKNYNTLRSVAGTGISFGDAMEQFTTMYRIAKNLRPGVKWGIYNLPYTTYWEKNEDWQKQAERLMPLYKMVDILMPSLYDFYPDTTKFTDDKTYFTDNTKLALQIGELLQKPVYAFIWQRYHESNPKVGLELIPQNEFLLDLNYILTTKYHNTAVSGIIWFDAQSFFHRVKKTLRASDTQAMASPETTIKETVIDRYAGYLKKQAHTLRGIN